MRRPNPDVEGICPWCAGLASPLARVPNPDRREESHVGAREGRAGENDDCTILYNLKYRNQVLNMTKTSRTSGDVPTMLCDDRATSCNGRAMVVC